MDYNAVQVLHKNDPAILAMRHKWLPLAVSFLHHTFKRQHHVLIEQDIFREQLDRFIEHVNATLPEDDQYIQSPDFYIDSWSGEDDLIRIRRQEAGYAVQLSPHAERLLGWFDEMLSQRIIGTESRLRNILSLLDEVVTRSTEDVQARLDQLYDRREQIDAEIERIEATQTVDGLSDVQIRERIEHISGLAGQLLRDFSLVEERFREMALAIQQAQLDPDARRGDILGTALDADEQLEASDEGQSFRAFYELLTHPEQRETFDDLVSALFHMPRLATYANDNALLGRLTSYLLEAGERVNQSNQQLAQHLRRVVDTRNIAESRRVQTLAGEIKHLSSQLGEAIVPMMRRSRTPFYVLEGEPEVDLPLERPLFEPPEQFTATERPRPASTLLDDDALSALFETFYIDETRLHENIERALMSRAEVPLAELVNRYPITKGMSEVIAYLQIAAREPGHTIDRLTEDAILIETPNQAQRTVTLPRIIFKRATPEADHV